MAQGIQKGQIGLTGPAGAAVHNATQSLVEHSEEAKRFRSFAERYVIQRASMFRVGFEKEDAFAAVMDAKTVYKQIELAGAALVAAERNRVQAEGLRYMEALKQYQYDMSK